MNHDFVSVRHCKDCRNGYMQSYRQHNGQKQYRRPFDRDANLDRIQWLRDNGIHLRIVARQAFESVDVLKDKIKQKYKHNKTIALLKTFLKDGQMSKPVFREAFKTAKDQFYDSRAILSIKLAIKKRQRTRSEEGLVFEVGRDPQLEVDPSCSVCDKACDAREFDHGKIARVLHRAVPIKRVRLRIPWNGKLTGYAFAEFACNHDWSYTLDRIKQLAYNFQPLCDCSWKVKKGTNFDRYSKTYGICKGCLSIVGTEFPSIVGVSTLAR